jgi:hypothetical protein
MVARNKRMEQTGANPRELPEGPFERPATPMLRLSKFRRVIGYGVATTKIAVPDVWRAQERLKRAT